jgi:hypothetical protein
MSRYNYKILTEYITPDEKGRYPHFTHIEDQEGLTRTLEEVFNHLQESVPDGWDVVSHNITISRNTLIITILLRSSETE